MTMVHVPVDDAARPVANDEDVKAFHRNFPTGVMIVTTTHDSGNPVGLAVNAFSSVSMEPPTVLLCVKKTSQSHDVLKAGQHVGVNILAHDQVDVAAAFAKSGGDKFANFEWFELGNGSPALVGASGTLEMEVVQLASVGTHTVFFGVVTQADSSAIPPLVYHDGRFFDGALLVES